MTFDAEDVERRVLGCGDVVRLTGGPGGVGVAPPRSRRVDGVRDLDPGVEVHVVARWGFTAAALTTQVRSALATVAGPIMVVIDDVTTPYDPVPGRGPLDIEIETSDLQEPERIHPETDREPVVLTPVEPAEAVAPVAVVPVAVVPVALTTAGDTIIVTVEIGVAPAPMEIPE